MFGDALRTGAADVAGFSDIIFLGVKPVYLGAVLDALAPHITRKHTVVSIAAGWTIAQLEARLPKGTAVVRVMPNTPILVGQGASGFCLGRHASEQDAATVQVGLMCLIPPMHACVEHFGYTDQRFCSEINY